LEKLTRSLKQYQWQNQNKPKYRQQSVYVQPTDINVQMLDAQAIQGAQED
jgi:hypothetical protein